MLPTASRTVRWHSDGFREPFGINHLALSNEAEDTRIPYIAIQVPRFIYRGTSTYVHQGTHSGKFLKAMNWTEPKWPPTAECMNKRKHGHTIWNAT